MECLQVYSPLLSLGCLRSRKESWGKMRLLKKGHLITRGVVWYQRETLNNRCKFKREPPNYLISHAIAITICHVLCIYLVPVPAAVVAAAEVAVRLWRSPSGRGWRWGLAAVRWASWQPHSYWKLLLLLLGGSQWDWCSLGVVPGGVDREPLLLPPMPQHLDHLDLATKRMRVTFLAGVNSR